MRCSRDFKLACCGICFALVGCNSGTTDQFVEQLRDPDPQVRRAAIRALAEQQGDAQVIVPALEQALTDSDTATRLSAAVAIQKMDPANQSAPPLIIESLKAGHASMFLEVGRMGTAAEWAVPTLLKLLSHRQPQIRALAARALGEIGVADGDVQTALERRLRDDSPAVRNAAQTALGQLQSPPAEE